MRRASLKITYSTKLTLVMTSVVLLLTILLSVFFWEISSYEFTSKEEELFQRSITNIQKQVNTTLEASESATTRLISEIHLIEGESADFVSKEDFEKADAHISNLMRMAMGSQSGGGTSIRFLSVIMKNGYVNTVIGNNRVSDTIPWSNFEECCSYADEIGVNIKSGYVPSVWVDNYSYPIYLGDISCLIGIRFVYAEITLEKIGAVIIGIDQSVMKSIYGTITYPAGIVRRDGTVISEISNRRSGKLTDIVDELGEIMQSTGSGMVKTEDGRTLYVGVMPGDACCLVSEMTSISQDDAAMNYEKKVFMTAGVVMLLGIILSVVLSLSLTGSLRKLTKTVEKVYEGDLSARYEAKSGDEIAYLGLKINDMLEQVEDFFKTQERDAATKRLLEMKVLQSQINPHLLYNTLNSVIWIIRQNDADKAEKLLLSMSAYFRLALSRGNEEITLYDEVQMIHHYLIIQNLGRGKSFTLVNEIPEKWLKTKILRLSLQPIAENAVLHGFADWRNDGTLTISAEEDGNKLKISITDNGIGIMQSEMDEIMKAVKSEAENAERKHFGLYNIHRRIQTQYGNEYGLSMDSQVGEYTRVSVTIPMEETSND